MANYYGSTRTNYFKVTDENAFKELIGRCVSDGEEVSVWTHECQDGTVLYGFGCYGDILGLSEDDGDDEDYDYNYDAFIGEIQKLLPEDEAAIITHVGQEKLRYLTGCVTVITKDKIEYNYLSKLGVEMARTMLGNPNWGTKNEY